MNLYHSTAETQQALVAARPGRLCFIHAYNNNAATRYLQVYDLPRAVTAAVSGVAEVSTVDFNTLDGEAVAGTYFVVYGADGELAVWFNTGADTRPDSGHARYLEVVVAAEDDDEALAAALADALDDYNDGEFTASDSTTVVTITDGSEGARQNIVDGDTGAAFATDTAGVDEIPSPLLSLVMTIPVAAGASVEREVNLPLFQGIVIANSTADTSYTAGGSDFWFTAVYE